MSMIKISGRTISVAKLDEAQPEVGSRKQAVDGTILIERIGHLRKWTGKTPALSPDQADVVRKLVRGDGDTWPFSADIWSSKGLNDEAGTQFTLEGDGDDDVAVTNAYAMAGSVYISAASVNLFSANVRTGTDTSSDTTDWVSVSGATLSSDTSAYWQGSRSLKVVSLGANDGAETPAIAISASTAYTCSFYIRSAVAATLSVELEGDVSGSLLDDTFAATTEWMRVVKTVETAPGDSDLTLRIYDAAGGETFYVDGVQMEELDAATAWVNGTRAADDSLTYPAAKVRPLFKNDFTVQCWFAVHDNSSFSGADQPLFAATNSEGSAPTEGIEIYESSGEVIATVYGGDGTPDLSVSDSSAAWNDGAFHLVTVVLKRTPGTGEFNLTLYLDGTSVDTDNGTEFPAKDAVSIFEVGSWRDGALQGNCKIEDLMVLPYAANAEQVTYWYAQSGGGAPMSALPKVYVQGDFIPDDDPPPLAVGQVGLADYVAAAGSGNYREVGFELMEAALTPVSP